MSLLSSVLSHIKKTSLPESFYAKQEPLIPDGGFGICHHVSAFTKKQEIRPDMLSLVPLEKNVSYREFIETNSHLRFCDSAVLDAIIQIGTKQNIDADELVSWCFEGVWGQIFFLGTTFNSSMGEAVAFLNWRTEAPAFRYLCPIDNPVRFDLPVYACVVQ